MNSARCLLQIPVFTHTAIRNAFTAAKPDPSRPNMLRVGVAFGSTAILWATLFRQHQCDVQEYKEGNGLQ